MTVTEKQQNKVALFYGAAWASLILVCIPSITFAIVASILFFVLLIVAYIIRKKSVDGDFVNNHMRYIIKTLWFSLFILPAITLTVATIYMIPKLDNSSLMPCAQPLAEHLLENPDMADIQILYEYIEPCMHDYMMSNKAIFFIATLIAALPILIYMIYRFGKGTLLTFKSKTHNNPKSWLK